MFKPVPSPEADEARYNRRVAELRALLGRVPPLNLALHTSATFEQGDAVQGQFRFSYWEKEILLSYPDFVARLATIDREMPLIQQALFLYYFSTADGAPWQDRWISFADLADGRFYNLAFQGYTGQELARHFKNDQKRFESAALAAGGVPATHGNLAFRFQALPRVPLLAVYWVGDDDFPASCQILFDASANHYLPTDAFAILGSSLTRRLIAASPPVEE
jgi:hypothetical protein